MTAIVPIGFVKTEGLERERKRLYNFIRRRVRTSEDAEDILQDVFYQLLSSAPVAEPIANVSAWLFTSARNKIIDWYRKRRHLPLPDESDDFVIEIADTAAGPDIDLVRTTIREALADALGELPKEQRDVFVMHELEGLSFREIAGRTGVPLNTLLSRKHYAVVALREQLGELYDELNDD